jgi:hypothetical protein
MAANESDPRIERLLDGLRDLQEEYREPVADLEVEAPRAALLSLEEAVAEAPADYRPYLEEAVACYDNGLFRAAILMVWAAVMEHLYMSASSHKNGIKDFERENHKRYGGSKNYRQIKKRDDFLYLREYDFVQLAEDAGMLNRNARKLLHEKLASGTDAATRPSTSRGERRRSSSSRVCSSTFSAGTNSTGSGPGGEPNA